MGGSQPQLSSSITEGADYDRSRCPDRPAVAPMLRMPAIMSHCSAKTAVTQSITLRTQAKRRRSRVDIAQIQPRHLNQTSGSTALNAIIASA